MKYLPIKNSTRKVLIDDEDYNRCIMLDWYIDDDRVRTIKKPRKKLANFIMKDYTNIYDHIDRDFLNNQKSNLRIATRAQNSYNRPKQDNFKPCASNYKGVCWKKDNKLWVARITYQNIRVHLGYFHSEKAAARAYNKKAKEYFGEFACLNIIEED